MMAIALVMQIFIVRGMLLIMLTGCVLILRLGRSHTGLIPAVMSLLSVLLIRPIKRREMRLSNWLLEK